MMSALNPMRPKLALKVGAVMNLVMMSAPGAAPGPAAAKKLQKMYPPRQSTEGGDIQERYDCDGMPAGAVECNCWT
jgi:hypothetical protein